ncbi:MAG TPA: hypothetical protein VK673_21775 [Chthoniobacterales bacterium]|nr:hypothetical protein [Chthoniobacterales bacterium]
MSGALAEYAPDTIVSREQEPPKKSEHASEWQIPMIGTSPVTGLPGAPVWGGINKFSLGSRYSCGDADSDDEYNWLPMIGTKVQLPTPGTTIATLIATLIWQTEIYFNNNLYMFCMCSNGHLYQVTTSGTITDIWATAQFSLTGTLNGTTSVTGISSTANISVGMSVSGTDIQSGTIVTQINSGTAITISLAATGSTTTSLSFSTPLFTTSGTVDISVWQNTNILISDSAAQNIYNWNGTQLFIALNAQPVQYITVFQQRLWMGFNSTVQWTNINTFNSLSGDSGSFLITDAQCSNPINCLLDSPFGLFLSGSNWIKFITNLNDVGSPAVLTFQQNTIEGQIGPYSKWSVLVVGGSMFFGNTAGYWQLNGSQPAQISSPFLNQFFANFAYPQTTLSATYGMINSVPCVFFQAYYNGDQNVSAGYRLFGYTLQGNQWFSVNQGTIAWVSGAVSVANTNQNPLIWACDGTHLFQMFAVTNVAQNSQWNSKLWTMGSQLDIDNILNVALEVIANGPCTITVGMVNETNIVQYTPPAQSITPGLLIWTNNLGQVIQFVNNSGAAINFIGNGNPTYFLFQSDGLGRCRRFGINATVNGAGCVLVSVTVSIHKTEASRGS